MSQQLLARAEGWGDGGPLDADECVELARWLVRTGMVNSRGSYERFVEEVFDDMGEHWYG